MCFYETYLINLIRLDWNTRPEADWEGKVRNWNNTWTAGAGEQIADLNSWDGDMVQDQADDEDEMSTDEEERKQLGSLIRGKPQVRSNKKQSCNEDSSKIFDEDSV